MAKTTQPKRSLSDYRSGGPVAGGTPGVDTVRATVDGKQPARLDNGEYVLPAATVAALGGKQALDELVLKTNGKEPVGYALGGLIEDPEDSKQEMPRHAGFPPIGANSLLGRPADPERFQAWRDGRGAEDPREMPPARETPSPPPKPGLQIVNVPNPPFFRDPVKAYLNNSFQQEQAAKATSQTPPLTGAAPPVGAPSAVDTGLLAGRPATTPPAAPRPGAVDIPVSRPMAAPGARPIVSNQNDYITPMEGVSGRPIYRNLVGPDGQAEYGKAIYSDSVPGATRAGLDQAVGGGGKGSLGIVGGAPGGVSDADYARMSTPEKSAAKVKSIQADAKAVRDLTNTAREYKGLPHIGPPKPSNEALTLAQRQYEFETGRLDKSREQQQGLPKQQFEEARARDAALAERLQSFAPKAGELPGSQSNALSDNARAFAMEFGSQLNRTPAGRQMGPEGIVGLLHPLATEIPSDADALQTAMERLEQDEPTPDTKALARKIVQDAKERATAGLLQRTRG